MRPDRRRPRPRTSRAEHGVRVAVDAMGGDHGPEEVVQGALDLRACAARRPGDPRRRRGRIRRASGRRPAAERLDRPRGPGHRDARAPGDAPCARRRTPRSSSRWTSSSAARPTPSSRRVTRVPAWPPRSCGWAACPASTGPRWPSRWSPTRGPFVLLDIGANPDSTPGEPGPVRAHGRDLRGAGAGRRRGRGSPFCRSARRRARATPGSSGRRELLDGRTSTSSATSRARTWSTSVADVVVCDAVLGNVTIKFFEGLSTFIFDLVRARVPRLARGAAWRTALMRPGIDRIRTVFDYEKLGGSPLLGVARDRDHHPRPGEAADGSPMRSRSAAARPGRGSRS